MSAAISKTQIARAIDELPDTATVDDAIERLLFLSRIEEGLGRVQRGETLTHEEVQRRIEAQITSWQK